MSQLLIYGVRFKKASRVFDFDGTLVELTLGDQVIVEVEKGLGMGVVVNGPREPVNANRKIKKIIRRADVTDVERFSFNTEREDEAFSICREKITKYNLPMKLVSVEYLFDSSKAIFYFTSDTRVDFRGLVKDLAAAFHTRIEMRQIGVRDEAKMIGGLGPCGRVLCCASFLSDFEPVTIKMAKDQNLALNPVKISGVCGRLMCCLSFEHEAYKKGKAGARSAGHGCHKGGGGKDKHCGAHGASKQGVKQGEKQVSAQRPADAKQAQERQGRPERGRPGRNRPGRNRPGRNRQGENRPGSSRVEDGAAAEGNAPAVGRAVDSRLNGAKDRIDKGRTDRNSGQNGESRKTEGARLAEGDARPRRPDSTGRGRNRNRNRSRSNRNRNPQENRQAQGNRSASPASRETSTENNRASGGGKGTGSGSEGSNGNNGSGQTKPGGKES